MAIVYYPNKTLKKLGSAIDRVMAKRDILSVSGAANVASSGLDAIISANSAWQIESVKLNFSNSASRDYGWNVVSGRKVVAGENDYLWFQLDSSLWERIILDENFYTGDALATELQTKLNAAFSPITFTVAYSSITGLFSITPSSGKIRYIHTNKAQVLPYTQSIAGHLFGFTVTSTFQSSLSSDTPAFGLNSSAAIISETDSNVLSHYNDDLHVLSVDQALNIVSNTASVQIDFEVTFEEIV